VLLCAGVFALAALAFRKQLVYLVKVAKACATDERLPRPLRWALTLALAIKVVPLPDFGVDEIILLVVGVLLATVYRPTFLAILAESRPKPPPVEAERAKTSRAGPEPESEPRTRSRIGVRIGLPVTDGTARDDA
jgi:hypothetical protein